MVRTVDHQSLRESIRFIIDSHITFTKLDESNVNVYSWDGKPFLHTWLDKEHGKIVWKLEEIKSVTNRQPLNDNTSEV